MIDNVEKVKLSQGQKKKLKKKILKEQKKNEQTLYPEHIEDQMHSSQLTDLDVFELKDGFQRFENVYEEDEKNREAELKESLRINDNIPMKATVIENLQTKDEPEEDDGQMNRTKWKRLNRISTGNLKLEVKRPDLVEQFDHCSKDPHFLLELKSKRHSVPVPAHWSDKGKYLQGKRGFIKPPFRLPDSIAATGIMDMRPTNTDKIKNLKTQMKEKIRPKVGVVDLGYQTLYDAFHVHLKKPELSKFGEIYYHGKEIEGGLKKMRPGPLSDDLKSALGMPSGSNGDKYPPPYLIAQQRYGPPPSYPNLKIQGLNAPLPNGASFGLHIGGWGQPPVDERGNPIYGDVFLTQFDILPPLPDDDFDEIDDGEYWGGRDTDEEDSDEERSEQDKEEVIDEKDNYKSESVEDGLFTPSFSCISTITETPTVIELRKKPVEDETVAKDITFCKVIKEISVPVGASLMGNSKLYEIPSEEFQLKKRKLENNKTENTSVKGEPKAKKKKDFKF